MRLTVESDDGHRLRLPYLAALAILVLVSPMVTLAEAGRVAWPWLLVGAVVSGLTLGPFARTAAGRAVDHWFTRIGVAGRVLAIVVFAVVVWTVRAFFQPDPVSVNSFVVGGMVAVLFVGIAERLLE